MHGTNWQTCNPNTDAQIVLRGSGLRQCIERTATHDMAARELFQWERPASGAHGLHGVNLHKSGAILFIGIQPACEVRAIVANSEVAACKGDELPPCEQRPQVRLAPCTAGRHAITQSTGQDEGQA